MDERKRMNEWKHEWMKKKRMNEWMNEYKMCEWTGFAKEAKVVTKG